MKLSNKYKTSEYIFLFSILVLALLLGTYFSFYEFLWRDIESEVKGFSKTNHMNYQEGITNSSQCPPGHIQCPTPENNCNPNACIPETSCINISCPTTIRG